MLLPEPLELARAMLCQQGQVVLQSACIKCHEDLLCLFGESPFHINFEHHSRRTAEFADDLDIVIKEGDLPEVRL